MEYFPRPPISPNTFLPNRQPTTVTSYKSYWETKEWEAPPSTTTGFPSCAMPPPSKGHWQVCREKVSVPAKWVCPVPWRVHPLPLLPPSPHCSGSCSLQCTAHSQSLPRTQPLRAYPTPANYRVWSVRSLCGTRHSQRTAQSLQYTKHHLYVRADANERTRFIPDATMVLAHSVFSMLRLSWTGGSQSSCSEREKGKNGK